MSWWTTTRGAITSTRSSSRARSISPSKASAWPFRRPSSSGSRAEIPNPTGCRATWASSSTTRTSPAPASSSAIRGSRRRAGRRKSSGCSRAGSNTSWTPSPTRTSSTSPRSTFLASSKRRTGWTRPPRGTTIGPRPPRRPRGARGHSMDVRFWGTRGSVAKPGPTTLRYGGNTSCVEVQGVDGTLIVLDCGTGAGVRGRAALRWSPDDHPHPLGSHPGIPVFRAALHPGEHVGHLCSGGARTATRTDAGRTNGVQLLPRHPRAARGEHSFPRSRRGALHGRGRARHHAVSEPPGPRARLSPAVRRQRGGLLGGSRAARPAPRGQEPGGAARARRGPASRRIPCRRRPGHSRRSVHGRGVSAEDGLGSHACRVGGRLRPRRPRQAPGPVSPRPAPRRRRGGSPRGGLSPTRQRRGQRAAGLRRGRGPSAPAHRARRHGARRDPPAGAPDERGAAHHPRRRRRPDDRPAVDPGPRAGRLPGRDGERWQDRASPRPRRAPGADPARLADAGRGRHGGHTRPSRRGRSLPEEHPAGSDHSAVRGGEYGLGLCRRGDRLSDEAVQARARPGPRPSLADAPPERGSARAMSDRDRARIAPSRETDVNRRLVSSLESLSRASSVLVAVVGLVALLGWQLDVELLTSGLPGRVAMNPTTALALILAAGSLWMQHRAWRKPSAPTLMGPAIRVAAVLIVALGMITLAAYVSGHELGLDQIVFRTRLGDNRISPNGGLSLVLIGTALWLLDWRSRARRAPEQLAA